MKHTSLEAQESGNSDGGRLQRPYGLLINRNFAWFFGGQVVSTIGDYIFTTTLILWIAQRLAVGKPWAPLAVGGELIAVALPSVVIGPFAGVFVDRWDKRRTMLRMDLFRSVVLLALLPLSTEVLPAMVHLPVGGYLAALYVALVLVTAGSQFFNPARLGLISDLVPVEDRARASSLVFMTLSLGIVIGPAVAAPLYFAFGPAWALLLDSASFMISYLAIWATAPSIGVSAGRKVSQQGDAVARAAASGSKEPYDHSLQGPYQQAIRAFLSEFLSGGRYFWSNSILRTLVIVTSVTLFGASAINSLGIFFLTVNLARPPEWYGLLETSAGVGVLIGSIGAALIVPRLGAARCYWLGTVLTGLLLMLYARQTNYVLALALLIAIGFPSAALNVAIGPLLLQAAPRSMLGRIAALFAPVTNLAALLSTALVGYLATTVLRRLHLQILAVQFGPYDTLYLLGGFIIVCSGAYAWANLRDDGLGSTAENHGHVRRLQTQNGGPI
jgi:MFS family permease